MPEPCQWFEDWMEAVNNLKLPRSWMIVPPSAEALTLILNEQEWNLMERAGILAFECRHGEAEHCRSMVGYHGLGCPDDGPTKYDSEETRKRFNELE